MERWRDGEMERWRDGDREIETVKSPGLDVKKSLEILKAKESNIEQR